MAKSKVKIKGEVKADSTPMSSTPTLKYSDPSASMLEETELSKLIHAGGKIISESDVQICVATPNGYIVKIKKD